MKHKKLILVTAVILIVSMASVFLFACAKENEQTEPTPEVEQKPSEDNKDEATKEPETTADDVRNAISKAMYNSYVYDNTKPVGFEYGFETTIDGKKKKLTFKGYIDTKTATNSKLELKFEDGEDTIFTLSSDDSNLYYTSLDVKKRITGFNLADIVIGQTMPNSESTEGTLIAAIPDMLMSLFFGSDKDFAMDNIGGKVLATVSGDMLMLSNIISDMIYEQFPELSDQMDVFFENLKLEMKVTIDEDNKIEDMKISFITKDYGDADGTFLSNVGNFDPQITTPNKDDSAYVETRVLNFAIEGKVDMTSPVNFKDTPIATYEYQIYVDLDLFAMLRNAIIKNGDSITFDATKLFDIDEGSIYINLSHICVEGDGCNKVEPSKGSILTAAFSPKDFGTRDFYLALKPLSILPKGFLSDAIGLGGLGETIEALIPCYMATNINPAALFTNVSENASEMSSTYATIPTDINLVSVIESVLGVISEIRLDDINGLRIGVDEVVDLLYELDPIIDSGDINVPLLVKMLFGDASHMYIDVDRAVYGDDTLENKNYYRMFMTIDEKVGEYKFDDKVVGPVTKLEPTLDTNGNVVIFSTAVTAYEKKNNDGTFTYTPLPLTRGEVEKMISSPMNIEYKYTTVTGKTGTAKVAVNGIVGLDLDKAGKQKVEFVTGLTDGNTKGSIGALIGAVGLLGIKIEIPGNVFSGEIEIINDAVVTFSQASKQNAIDESKTYNFGDKLTIGQDVTITYGNGENAYVKKFNNINPTKGGDLVVNGTIKAVDTFTLEYEFLGEKLVRTITMNKANITTPIADENVSLVVGEEYNKILSAIKFSVDGKPQQITPKMAGVTFTLPEGVELYKTGLGQTKLAVAFDKAGKYEIVMDMQGGISKKFIFDVQEDNTVDIPLFTASISENGDNFKVTVGRENQLGDLDEVKVALQLKANSIDEDAVLTSLVFGEDYKIKVDGKYLDTNEMVLPAFQGVPSRFEIEILNDNVKTRTLDIQFLAVDHDMQEIGGGSINLG